jgi:hypothetical protein
MLLKCAHFILSEWIWGATWDTYHVVFNSVIMILLLKFFLNIDMVRAVFVSIMSQLFAFFLLTICAFIALYSIGPLLGPDSFMVVPKPLYATLALGLMYAFFQIMFFMLGQRWIKISVPSLIVITLISNNLTVLITWLLYSIE